MLLHFGRMTAIDPIAILAVDPGATLSTGHGPASGGPGNGRTNGPERRIDRSPDPTERADRLTPWPR
jgi:hypothetical protein